MSDTLKERMSALLDGELEPDSASETIDVVLNNEDLLVHWSRCHLVRDVLRHKVYPDAGAQLRDRVRSCLADEPLHFPVPRPASQRWRKTLKPIAGLALAASVGVVALLAVRGVGHLPDQPDTARAPSIQVPTTQVAARATAAIVPASAVDAGALRPSGLRRLQWNSSEPGVANRLNGYLVNHSEHLGSPISSMHPYARIVGYDTTGKP
jgi:sigma-E factor negative regulatory protein RseA